MSRILSYFIVFTVFCFFPIGKGSAAALPSHDDICTGGVVSKDLLVNYLIGSNDNKGAQKLVIGHIISGRALFTDEQLCSANVVCRAGQKASACDDEVKACTTAQTQAIVDARIFFDALTVETAKKAAAIYTESASLKNTDPDKRAQKFFGAKDSDNSTVCSAANDVNPPPPPSAIEASQFRVRGVSDDLYVDRNDKSMDKAFKATSQATLTSTGDRSTNPTQTLKAKAALGYAFDVSGATVIPYISFYQSITDTFGKPQSTDPTSNVAAGMLFTSSISRGLVNNVFGAKPQYLLNTKDHSEIGSLRLSYTPYTFFAGDTPNLNFFQPIPFLPMLSADIIFDLRLDAGVYANRGNDPVQSLLNRDFVRSGSRFGLAFTTDPNTPSFTLILAETCLYGFAGTVRNLNIFDASLTYNFNKYVGLTGTYRNGIDEDTAIRTETWMVGLSGRF
jgi:hypothetical protein